MRCKAPVGCLSVACALYLGINLRLKTLTLCVGILKLSGESLHVIGKVNGILLNVRTFTVAVFVALLCDIGALQLAGLGIKMLVALNDLAVLSQLDSRTCQAVVGLLCLLLPVGNTLLCLLTGRNGLLCLPDCVLEPCKLFLGGLVGWLGIQTAIEIISRAKVVITVPLHGFI